MNTALDQVLVKNVDGPAASSHICLLKKINKLHTHTHSVMDELKSARKLARNEKQPSDFLPHYFRECLLTHKAWKPAALCDVNENAGFSLPPNYGFYSKSAFPQRAETQQMQI